MPIDRTLDPMTGDVKDAPAGQHVVGDDLENKVMMSYLIDRGSWEGDPTMGHRLRTMERESDTAQTRIRLGQLLEEPVQWLKDLSELESVAVDVQSFANGIVGFVVNCYRPGARKPVSIGPMFVTVGIA